MRTTSRGIVGAALLALTLAGCAASPNGTKPLAPASPTDTTSSSQAEPADATPSYHTPAKKDFTLSIKTLTKECFGYGAGCIVTFRVKMAYDRDAGMLDPAKTYELTYEVRGGEQPLTETAEITGKDYSVPEEQMADTKSSKSKLTAVVTEVSEK